MAETIIFTEQDIVTQYMESIYVHAARLDPAPFSLVIGEKYRVVWDGQPYDLEGFDCSQLMGEVAVGDGSQFGLSGGGEPFAIIYDSYEGSNVTIIAWEDAEPTTHRIAVYQITESEEPEEPDIPEEPSEPEQPEGIVLKDRNGKDVAYYGIETVTFDTTTEGKQQTYTKGIAVEGLEIVPDFASGDMAVTAEKDTLIRSAVIKKTEDLTPENIRKGKKIAGISGNFIGDTEEIVIGESDGAFPLNFASDDIQEFVPTSESKVISKITVEKPATLNPDNIALGVNIAGIVGALAGGSNVMIKQVTFPSNVSGTVTLATAADLATVGFDPSGKCFIAIVPQSYIGTSKSSPGVMVGALVVKHFLYSNTTNYYGMLLTGYYSSYKTNPNYKAITNNPFSGTLVTDTPCYVDGNIVYDATNSTVKLDDDTFFVLAGNLTTTV